jgi:hypothetical protein
MRRRDFISFIGGVTAWPFVSNAQPVAQNGAKPARIGWLTAQREASLTPYVKAMRTA